VEEDVLYLGILGAADIAVSRVIPSLSKSKKVRVFAIASRDSRKAKEWAGKLGIEKYYGSYDELLESEEVEAVYIPLVNSLHCEWTLKSLQKGKHVICEKPLALTSEEARGMIRIAMEKKLTLMEAFMYRYHPRNRAVFNMAKSGELGELRAIESCFSYVLDDPSSYLMSRELGGGALFDVGCYCVNVSRMLTGLEPVEVYGTANITDTKVDMTFAGMLRFAGGIVSSFHVSMNEEPRFSYRVVGEKGLIEVPWAFVSFGKETKIIVQHNEKQKEISYNGVDEYVLEFENFADVVKEEISPLYSVEDSLKNMYVIEALFKSAHERRPVRV
jgi:predicted dehydrogenase